MEKTGDRGREERRTLAGAYAAAEAIASSDHSSLHLTSCFFADRERYKAFCAYYALMRIVDDRIDGLPDRAGLSERDRIREHEVVSAWETAVRGCCEGRDPPLALLRRCGHADAAALLEAFAASLPVYPAPLYLWESFFRSMHWDLDHDRFDSWRDFLAYTEGASVSPTTIYLALLASRPNPPFHVPSLPAGFNLRKCGQELGTFAYLGHIVRDMAEDLGTGRRGLVYLTREDMTAHGVTEHELRRELEKGSAGIAIRGLVADLVGRARDYLREGRKSMVPLRGAIDEDCTFVLELIVTMYDRLLDKIEACGFDTLGGRHRLTTTDRKAIVREVAGRTGFEVTAIPGAPSVKSTGRPHNLHRVGSCPEAS